MKTLLRGGLILTLISGVLSCTIQKRIYMTGYYIDWINFASTTPTPQKFKVVGYSLNAYNSLSRKLSQETIIDVNNPGEIYCDEGTIVKFPDNAFVYEDGRNIKCSQVAVYITEFYTMSDILEAGLTTSSNNRTLASAGMVYIEARCHGEKLKLKPNKQVIVKMPTSYPDKTMKAFSGKLKNGIIDWKVNGSIAIENVESFPDSGLSDSPERFIEYEGESGREYPEAYIMRLSTLGWINCDRFYDTKKSTNLIVKADSIEKTFVAMIFKGMKSVLPGYEYANHSVEFKSIPTGQEVSVLAYRVNEKTKLVMVGHQDMVIGDTSLIELTMETMTQNAFKTLLAGYN
ncbi:MAG: hypothetical protein H7141_10485 [Burkholderiales bacterium]|nr:hypothetical protein [Bacteroidia bacterium]